MTSDAAEDLANLLSESGFTQQAVEGYFRAGIASILSDVVRKSLSDSHLARPLDAATVLIRLFVKNEALSSPVKQLLSPRLWSGLLEAQCATDDGTLIVPSLSISPISDRYFLSNKLFAITNETRLDFPHCPVMPPHASSFLTLDRLARIGEGRPLLDVGTGCGIVAILGEQRGFMAAGMDIDPLAVELARRNSVLNKCEVRFGGPGKRLFAADAAATRGLVIFNSPAGPYVDESGACRDDMSVGGAADVAREAAHNAGLQDFDLIVFGLQMLATPWPAAQRVISDRQGQYEYLEEGRFTLTAEELLTGRPHPGSLLFTSREEFLTLRQYLEGVGAQSLWPVIYRESK